MDGEMELVQGASIGYGGMHLADGDILVVYTSRNLSQKDVLAVRSYFEAELKRLGVSEPKVLSTFGDCSLSVIGRS